MSLIAWLDTSADEERRMRELVKLFSDSATLDDLGIGQIRDAFADVLFPGTSTLHTRARYFLFIPWLFQSAARSKSGSELAMRAHKLERRFVLTLRDEQHTDGLIGKQAGELVKVLPSTIYWSALRRYRVLARSCSPQELTQSAARRDLIDGMTDTVRDWNVPIEPPEGFPSTVEGGFSLRREEARWLQERIKTATPSSLFEYLVSRPTPLAGEPSTLWEIDELAHAPAEVQTTAQHAELFSLTIHGAQLLYNLRLAEEYEKRGFTTVDQPIAHYQDLLTDWTQRISDRRDDLGSWNRQGMWSTVLTENPRITPSTRAFVDSWLDAVASGRAQSCAKDAGLRRLISDREWETKRNQSRLRSERLLGTWQGASGSARLTYRWRQVSRILNDIHEGLHHAGA